MSTIQDEPLAALGRDALDRHSLTQLARTVTGEPAAEVQTVRVEPSDYLIGTPTTEALLRLHGTAALPDGTTIPWSCFVKKLQSVRHWSMLHVVPEPMRADFIRRVPWRLELAVHRSNLSTLLPDGFRLATAYRIDEYDDERATLWMENVDQVPGPWPFERFQRAAYLLGRLSARRQPHLVEPLTDSASVTTPGAALRYYTQGRVQLSALPALADDETWRHPLLAEAVSTTGDHHLQEDLLALGERLPVVLDALDALPQCYQHGDASPQNLLVPRDNQDEFVVIDWGFECPQAVGFDLGQLLVGLAHAGELAPEALPMIHRAILKAFLEGLKADGMQVTAEQVLYGYLGSLLARATFTALPLELFGMPASKQSQAIFDQRVRLTRVLVDLVSTVI